MPSPSRKLWGGRFKGKTSAAVERFTHSLSVDQRLARWDLAGSIAHAEMLGKQGIIPRQAGRRIVRALKEISRAVDRKTVVWSAGAEDIHTAIQELLARKIGAAAGYLHAGRSRNDQVVTSFRLCLKAETTGLIQKIHRLQKAVLKQARKKQGTLLPGMTHLRHAQPVLLSHLLLSYLAPLQRDRGRLADALSRMNESPLGSAALAGTGLAIDRAFTAKRLGFSGPMANSIDGVTDRDFVVELLSALALTGLHLARIAEDLILFSTEAFGYLRFDEKLLTGSSMMPQKQNPDFLELIRAGSARISGQLAAGLALFKGLPSGYQRDLQWDKAIVFEALDQAQGMVELLTDGFGGLRWNEARTRRALEDPSLYATDLAEYLAMKKIPWALAHQAVGRLLAHAQVRGIPAARMPLQEIRRFSPAFGPDLYRLFDPRVSVGRKRSFGSTSPQEVARAIRRWQRLLAV